MIQQESLMIPKFFESDDYFIDEKINYFKFGNTYNIFNKEAEQVGIINQTLPTWQKFLRLLVNKALFPFVLEVKDMDDNLQVLIKRGWTFWMSKITIHDAQDKIIGTIKQKFKLFKPTFLITNASDNLIATITGDWKAWDFKIKDANEKQIGTINKKWGGLLKEAFTRADKYYVAIDPDCKEDTDKIAIVACAITIDMVLKNQK